MRQKHHTTFSHNPSTNRRINRTRRNRIHKPRRRRCRSHSTTRRTSSRHPFPKPPIRRRKHKRLTNQFTSIRRRVSSKSRRRQRTRVVVNRRVMSQGASNAGVGGHVVRANGPGRRSFPCVGGRPMCISLYVLGPVTLTGSSEQLRFMGCIRSRNTVFITVRLETFYYFHKLRGKY